MTTEEILAAARAGKKPEAPRDSAPALEALEQTGDAKPTERRHLTAEDIRDIGSGKYSVCREQPVATEPLEKTTSPEAGDAKPDTLPEKTDRSNLTAADILAMGQRR